MAGTVSEVQRSRQLPAGGCRSEVGASSEGLVSGGELWAQMSHLGCLQDAQVRMLSFMLKKKNIF